MVQHGMIPCHNKAMATWHHDTIVPWHQNAMAPSHDGTMAPPYHGELLEWYNDIVAPSYQGTLAPRYHGTKHHATMRPRYLGTVVPTRPTLQKINVQEQCTVGTLVTMRGLPSSPYAEKMDVSRGNASQPKKTWC